MDTLKRKSNILMLLSLFLCAFSVINAQDYYGGSGGDSWRKKPPDKQPEEPKSIAEPSGFTAINAGFANPEGSFASSFGSGYGGYALEGFDFNFSFGVPISHSNFGLAFLFGSYNNNYDINNYVNYL